MDNLTGKLDGLDWVTNPDKVRKKIIDAASVLYARKGFADTSLQEVSEKAGVTRTVTRYHVKTKSEIMRMIMEDILTSFQENLIKIIKGIDDPKEKLTDALYIYLKIVDQQKEKALLIYQKSSSLDRASKSRVMQLEVDVSSIFAQIINEGIEQGVFKNVDVDLMAYNIMMLAHMWALKRWHFKKRLSLDAYFKLQLEIITDALKK
ncbi:MAG: TetR/AcrR family transcriptional regulator [Deltaproteobacteria bacterium]|nr:TetR/AcrR family transcriptional regulator [Deltaproteobacteria bacterium]